MTRQLYIKRDEDDDSIIDNGKACCQDSSTEEHWRVGHRLVRLAYVPIKRIQQGLYFA